jgi:hypothetical protein
VSVGDAAMPPLDDRALRRDVECLAATGPRFAATEGEERARELPGAADNATGLAALLAMARAWAGSRPRLTIALVAFGVHRPTPTTNPRATPPLGRLHPPRRGRAATVWRLANP